jgi:hypothetical protein
VEAIHDYVDGRPRPLVPGILGGANGTVARNHGNALRGAGAEKDHFHGAAAGKRDGPGLASLPRRGSAASIQGHGRQIVLTLVSLPGPRIGNDERSGKRAQIRSTPKGSTWQRTTPSSCRTASAAWKRPRGCRAPVRRKDLPLLALQRTVEVLLIMPSGGSEDWFCVAGLAEAGDSSRWSVLPLNALV